VNASAACNRGAAHAPGQLQELESPTRKGDWATGWPTPSDIFERGLALMDAPGVPNVDGGGLQ